jgi:hypothetical protein
MSAGQLTTTVTADSGINGTLRRNRFPSGDTSYWCHTVPVVGSIRVSKSSCGRLASTVPSPSVIHAASAQERDDLVRAQSESGGEGHGPGAIIWPGVSRR